MSLPPLLLASSRLLEVVNTVAYWVHTRARSPHRAPVPVISVGNLACGGTGKTPTVAALVRELLDAGCRPAVLTRGYRRRDRRPILVAGPEMPDWRRVGDEPALLAATLPGVPIVVDARRARGAAIAVARAQATHLVLDDGFQHWRLARDLDIVVVDAADPLARHVPRREHPRTLGRAGAIVVANADPAGLASAMAALRPFAPTLPMVATRTVVRRVHGPHGPESPDALRGARVMAVAGIAAPHRFLATLRRLGADPVRYRFFPDHHPLTPAELAALLTEADRERLRLVMTAKDAVKLPTPLPGPIHWLEVEVECIHGSLRELLRPLLPPVG